VRFASLVLLVAALTLVACGDDDDDRPSAQSVTTTTSTTESNACAGTDPAPPTAADGTPAEIAASTGDLTFAVVDHGASVDVVSIYVQDATCSLVPLRLNGEAAALAVGGSVTHGDGLRCDGDQVTVLSATSDDGATYQATAVTYDVDGTDLVEVDRDASTIEAQAASATLDSYYRLDCG
jgi:hypothetical protein